MLLWEPFSFQLSRETNKNAYPFTGHYSDTLLKFETPLQKSNCRGTTSETSSPFFGTWRGSQACDVSPNHAGAQAATVPCLIVCLFFGGRRFALRECFRFNPRVPYRLVNPHSRLPGLARDLSGRWRFGGCWEGGLGESQLSEVT